MREAMHAGVPDPGVIPGLAGARVIGAGRGEAVMPRKRGRVPQDEDPEDKKNRADIQRYCLR